MNRTISLVCLLLLLGAAKVGTQVSSTDELESAKMSAELLYEKKDLEGSLKMAKRALEISLRVAEEVSLETATAYENVGIIERELKRYDDSARTLQLSVDIFRQLPNQPRPDLITALDLLGLSQSLANRTGEAEKNYLLAIDLTGVIYGNDSREMFRVLLNLANFYAMSKMFTKSDEIYFRVYGLAYKLFDNNSDDWTEIDRVDRYRICLGTSETREYFGIPDFMNLRKRALGDLPKYPGIAAGLAVNLVYPKFPKGARPKPDGSAFVRVLIGEDGRVLKAEYICGPPSAEEVTVEAARKTVFPTTTVNGAPIKVKGILPYRYVP